MKSHLLFCCLLAYTKAVRSGGDVKQALRNAINTSLEDSYVALRTRFDGPSPATDLVDNVNWADEVSLENLFEWLQGDESTWMNGLDWAGDNGSAAPAGNGGV